MSVRGVRTRPVSKPPLRALTNDANMRGEAPKECRWPVSRQLLHRDPPAATPPDWQTVTHPHRRALRAAPSRGECPLAQPCAALVETAERGQGRRRDAAARCRLGGKAALPRWFREAQQVRHRAGGAGRRQAQPKASPRRAPPLFFHSPDCLEERYCCCTAAARLAAPVVQCFM